MTALEYGRVREDYADICKKALVVSLATHNYRFDIKNAPALAEYNLPYMLESGGLITIRRAKTTGVPGTIRHYVAAVSVQGTFGRGVSVETIRRIGENLGNQMVAAWNAGRIS
jgi:hypothetical protein